MKAIFIIKSDGTVIKSEQEKKPELEQLQKAVGGYIETVPHFTKLDYAGQSYTKGTAYCNEEGRITGLPFNSLATKTWLFNLGDGPFRYEPRLYGDVIFYATAK